MSSPSITDTAPASRMARIAATERPDLIVMIGYGDELPVYRHARALWQFYASHFPNIHIIFTRWTDKLAPGEIMHNGYDLLVGIGAEMRGSAAYASTGVWSGSENAKFVYRQVLVQDYLLRTHPRPFFFHHLTLTSVVDFRALSTVLDQLPAHGCYAGPMARLTAPEDVAGLTFTSGASTIFSRDALERMRERYDPAHPYSQTPNDVWQALMLHDYQRIALPTFNFLRPRPPRGDGPAVTAIARAMLASGHFHFRVKTVAPQNSDGRREDVDPWIMLRIMEAVLDSEPSPQATLSLMGRYARAVDGGAGAPLPPRYPQPIFSGLRDMPLSDEEVADPPQ
jgi:hypothetical protein